MLRNFALVTVSLALGCAHPETAVRPDAGLLPYPGARNILDACVADSTCTTLIDVPGAGLNRADELLATALRTGSGIIAHDWRPETPPATCVAVGSLQHAKNPPPLVFEAVKRAKIAARPRDDCEAVVDGAGWAIALRDSRERAVLLTVPAIIPPIGDTVQLSTSYEAGMLWSVTWLCDYVWRGDHWRANRCVAFGIS